MHTYRNGVSSHGHRQQAQKIEHTVLEICVRVTMIQTDMFVKIFCSPIGGVDHSVLFTPS